MDELDDVSSETAVGVVDEIGNTQKNRIQILNSLTGDEQIETIQHEVGHTLGLYHDGSYNNLMNASDMSNNELKPSQYNKMKTTVPTTIYQLSPPNLPLPNVNDLDIKNEDLNKKNNEN